MKSMSGAIAVNETEICIDAASDKECLVGFLCGERTMYGVQDGWILARLAAARRLPIIASRRNCSIVRRWDRGDNPFRAHYIRNSISLTMTRSHRIICVLL
jgi:hypothetical protein